MKAIKNFLEQPFKAKSKQSKKAESKKSHAGLDANGKLKKGYKYKNGVPVKV